MTKKKTPAVKDVEPVTTADPWDSPDGQTQSDESPLTDQEAPQTVTVIADKINIRSMPSLTSECLDEVHQGDVLTVQESLGDWLRIESGYVRRTGAKSGTVLLQ
jgi:uncharacterized protein YgiM (DUF1202 family)